MKEALGAPGGDTAAGWGLHLVYGREDFSVGRLLSSRLASWRAFFLSLVPSLMMCYPRDITFQDSVFFFFFFFSRWEPCVGK